MHNPNRMTIDPRIPTIPARSVERGGLFVSLCTASGRGLLLISNANRSPSLERRSPSSMAAEPRDTRAQFWS